MPERIAKREYYSIGEACEIVGLKPHILRYWESQFTVLRPSKGKAGNRIYRPKDIKLLQLLRQLLHTDRYTIEGAKRRLAELRESGEITQAASVAWDRETLADLRRDADDLVSILDSGGVD